MKRPGARGAAIATWLVALLACFTASPDALSSEPSAPPEWRWKQILATPRIGGRLTSVAVDPDDAKRIFVGTEEGTLVRTLDGGITWREIELTQSALKDRSVGLRQPRLPSLGAQQPPDFQIFIDPPNSDVAFRPSLFFPTLFFSIRPDFVFAGFLPPPEPTGLNLLKDASESRRLFTVPVRRIAICSDNVFNLMVATSRELYGSMDNGLTFVRLFSLPTDNIPRVESSGVARLGATIDNVVCSRDDPRRIAVATRVGLFLSSDGGLTFDQNLSGWPGQPATAIGYTRPLEGEVDPELFVATGDVLFAGNPESRNGLEFVYPDYKNATTAPWTSIRWVASSQDGSIWLATDDGLRASLDGGQSWIVPARSLFDRQRIGQVEVGRTADGRERVVVLARGGSTRSWRLNAEDWIYSSDDGGKSWHPFFNGITRRSFSQIATVPDPDGGESRWWVVTSGGLWTTHAAQRGAPDIDRNAQRWAKSRLSTTPPLPMLMRAVIDRTNVSADRLEDLWDSIRWREWLPEINAQLTVFDDAYARDTDRLESEQLVRGNNELTESRSFTMFANARWRLYWTTVAIERADSSIRRPLHELRRQVGFITEDAWHERILHLNTLAAGLDDPIQIDTLKTRVEGLEAILEVWLRGPLEEIR